jgi:hypothetical protein
MAMTKCKECGGEVSTKASACPKCGAVVKRTGCLTWIVAGFAPAPSKPKSPEEQAREQGIARASVAAKALRQAARNPDSFVLEKALVMPNGAACLEYRAQNGFGGMSREQAVVPADSDKLLATGAGGFDSAWNSQCAGKTGADVTYQVRQYMKLI